MTDGSRRKGGLAESGILPSVHEAGRGLEPWVFLKWCAHTPTLGFCIQSHLRTTALTAAR